MTFTHVDVLWQERVRHPLISSDDPESKRCSQARELQRLNGSAIFLKTGPNDDAIKHVQPEFCGEAEGSIDKMAVLKANKNVNNHVSSGGSIDDCSKANHVHLNIDDHAYVIKVIKDCGKQKNLFAGSRVHTEVLKNGLLDYDVSVGNALLSMYFRCGAFEEARATFGQLSTRNVVTFNALIAGYAQHGLGDEALSCFQQMQNEGLSPNAVTFICILKACGSIGAIDAGKEIHAEVHKQRLLEKNIVVGTALVDMYTKCGELAKAQETFDELPMHNVVSWNVLIAGYAQHGFGERTFPFLGKMQAEGVVPNAATFTCLLRACGSIGASDKGDVIVTEICRQALLDKDDMLGTAVVDMYAKCGDCAKAQGVFDKLKVRSVATWNALIAGYAEHGLVDEGFRWLEHMQNEGFAPNAATYTCIVKSCGNVRDLTKGEELHAKIDRQGLLEGDNILGTALLDMYANCMAMEKAQQVFDEFLSRDLVMWNALISGYGQNGLLDKALSCLDRMKSDGMAPDPVTFTCILKVCGSKGEIEKGEGIHAEIKRRGLLEKNIILGTTLVDMYAKCDALSRAQLVFNELPMRNVVTWNSLIGGYANYGHAHEALRCFEWMRNTGCIPDVVTFVCSLKACGIIKAILKGEEIHSEISRNGLLRKEIMLGNALVEMYAKCGAIEKAQGALEELSVRDVITWNVLIAGYVEHGFGERAISCLTQMQEEGLSPNSITYLCILKACSSIGAVYKGEEIHAEAHKQGLLEKDDMLLTALVDMYAKCGALVQAQELFDLLPVRTVVIWNALLGGYADHGYAEDALSCFNQMQVEGVLPDSVTFICTLKACGSLKALMKGEAIHTQADVQGLLLNDDVLTTALVDMYAKCGALRKAQDVFNILPVRTAITWNVLIAGYAQFGLCNDALACFRRMQKEGVSPNVATFSCILSLCGSTKAADKGTQICSEVAKQGLLEEDNGLGTAVVHMYVKCGLVSKAQDIFDKLPFRNVVTWNALLSGYVQEGFGDEALNCYKQMQAAGILPDVVTYICLSKACGSIGSLIMAEELHAEVDKHGLLEKDNLLGTALVDMYGKCGQLEKAQELFNKLPSQSVASWTALMAGLAQVGKVRAVVSLFQNVIKKGIKPDMIMFVVLLTACSHAGLVDEGQMYFVAMSSVYSIMPSIEHKACLVDIYSRAGLFSKAFSVIEQVSQSDSSLLWLTLLSACQNWLNVEFGRWIFDGLVQLHAKAGAVYVCTSNIYAATDTLEGSEDGAWT